MKNNKSLIALAVIILIAIVVFAVGRNGRAEWKTYVENDYNFQVSYPSDWVLQDSLTRSACCVFIAHVTVSTTTAKTATGSTTETVTARELIKLQIGNYDKKLNDPFKSGTTTEMSLYGNKFYGGESGAMQYYLLPRTDTTGIGAAVFPYTDSPEADKEMVKKIISTIKLLPVATTTSATTTPIR